MGTNERDIFVGSFQKLWSRNPFVVAWVHLVITVRFNFRDLSLLRLIFTFTFKLLSLVIGPRLTRLEGTVPSYINDLFTVTDFFLGFNVGIASLLDIEFIEVLVGCSSTNFTKGVILDRFHFFGEKLLLDFSRVLK